MLLLQFKGINSYLAGDIQLIYFEEIREFLLKDDSSKVLELELCFKKDAARHAKKPCFFPPIVRRKQRESERIH